MSGESGFRRCECRCRNVTGHSSGEAARCLFILEPGEGPRCKHCANCEVTGAGAEEEERGAQCGCPCWGFNVEAHAFEPRKASRVQLALRKRSRYSRRRRSGARSFGKEYSSDESGDGPSEKRRAVDREVDRVELREGLRAQGMQTLLPRVQRLICAAFLRRCIAEWHRTLELRRISEFLEHFGVEFPVENTEQLGAALRVLHEHGGYTWARLAGVFGTTGNTLSRIARGERGAGVRVSNRIVSAINRTWQEQVLEEAEMDSAPGGDACAICLLEVDEGDAERCPAGGQCSLIAHTECLAEALRRDPRCPQCRE